MSILCDIRLPLSWRLIEDARTSVAHTLRDYAANLRESAVMVASELAENVVKYGVPVAPYDYGCIRVSEDGGTIRIVSTNGVDSDEHLRKLSERVRALNESDDPESVYLERVRAILDNPKSGDAQLGLCRIVCEGGFRLSHLCEAGILTITADRSL